MTQTALCMAVTTCVLLQDMLLSLFTAINPIEISLILAHHSSIFSTSAVDNFLVSPLLHCTLYCWLLPNRMCGKLGLGWMTMCCPGPSCLMLLYWRWWSFFLFCRRRLLSSDRVGRASAAHVFAFCPSVRISYCGFEEETTPTCVGMRRPFSPSATLVSLSIFHFISAVFSLCRNSARFPFLCVVLT